MPILLSCHGSMSLRQGDEEVQGCNETLACAAVGAAAGRGVRTEEVEARLLEAQQAVLTCLLSNKRLMKAARQQLRALLKAARWAMHWQMQTPSLLPMTYCSFCGADCQTADTADQATRWEVF